MGFYIVSKSLGYQSKCDPLIKLSDKDVMVRTYMKANEEVLETVVLCSLQQDSFHSVLVYIYI